MSNQQVAGLVNLLVGVAALMVSMGAAWTLMLRSRMRCVERAWVVAIVSVALFIAGVALCWFGVSSLVGG
jgi:hypothetical protein